MEGAVDRIEASQVAPVPEEIAPGLLESLPDPKPAPGRTRQLDDIPSVVRALLTGYDEV